MTDHPNLCIHAHFYQPPREDPFSNQIPDEPGADPYLNWNDRILDTCYRPNAELGNFERISFNIGPTLSTWMTTNSSGVMTRIVEEDKRNVVMNGAGNAIAQPYNHTILPLSSRKDKETQVIWGIESFRSLYGRYPQGMWLPETAVDLETLDVLSEQGIEFTILAPWQIENRTHEQEHPCRIELDSGRSIVVFVYNSELSSRVSFDTLATANADEFAENLLVPEVKKSLTDGLMMIATDGELYGHHQPFRDKFLAHLLNGSTSGRGLKITYPALWLRDHPVTCTGKIRENSSWSCHHGISRWQGECGCSIDSGWKKSLREAFNDLAGAIDIDFEKNISVTGLDPQNVLNKYIEVILGKMNFNDWWRSIALQEVSNVEVQRFELLFKAQYERQRMFTSCGWFFGDLDRLELKNNISYAAHAVNLMKQATGFELPQSVLPLLDHAKSEKTGLSLKDRFISSLCRFEK